ncbi:MAG: hypothetical protein IT580_01055, partial [Verrucomicrobiales bacterium]|nr:hypothetical protein [Verrucomicrobiales bacterium]
LLGVTGLLVSGLFFGKGGMFVFVPGEIFGVYGPGEGAWRYALAHGMLVSKAVTILSLALMFSCFQVKPAAATILALSVLFVNAILTQIPFFEDLKPWFLTYHLNLWQGMLADPIPWWRIGASGSLLAAFNLSFLTVGAAAFHSRDIKT